MLSIGDSFEEFFSDRLKVQLREQGARHDLVDAVFMLRGRTTGLVSIVRRVEALGKFLDTEDGKNLLAGYKRATNILRIEEKKDGRSYSGNRILHSTARTRSGRSPRPSRSRGMRRALQSRARTSKPPCAPWRSFARMSMPSSTR